MTIRRAQPDAVPVLIAVQRAAEVAALAHIFPQDRYPFPTLEVHGRWRGALGRGDVRVLLASDACGRSGSHHLTRRGP